MFKSVKLTNFLSFGPDPVELELKPLNVLIGANGSGKSNLIEAFSLLRAAPGDLPARIRMGGGPDRWIWKGGESPYVQTADIETILDMPDAKEPLRYVIRFTSSQGRIEILEEKITPAYELSKTYPQFFYKYENGHPVLNANIKGKTVCRKLRRQDVNPERSILSQRRDPDVYPKITCLSENLEKIRIYSEWSFGHRSNLRLSQPADMPNIWLEEDCRNLGLVLNNIESDTKTKNELVKYFRHIFDGAEGFGVTVEAGSVQVFVREALWFITPATRLSDGTLRYLCLLAILCHPNPPPLICIEEPELGLHPDLIVKLADLLREAAKRTQLIVTTHSDHLVDALSDTPESIVVCEKTNGRTSLSRLDAKQLTPWLEKYSLGKLWRRGDLGGNRW